MPSLNDIPAEHLRDAWVSLAAYGTPPAPEVAAEVLPVWSVGLDDWLERLSKTFLRDYCRRNTHWKLAIAPYGGGKTHFLLAVAGQAEKEGWAVSYLQCKGNVTLSDWFSLYESIARSIQLPGSDKRGIRPLAKAALDRLQTLAAKAPDPDAALDLQIASLEEDEWPNAAFARVMGALLRHLREPSARPEIGDAALRWLQGQPETLIPAERQALRLAPINNAQKAEHGRTLLASLARFIPKAGAHGLVLLLDEMDVVFNARGRAMDRILNAMRIMLDAPDGRVDRTPVFGVFAAPPDVLTKLRDYPALSQRLRVQTPLFHDGNDNAAQIDLSKIGAEQPLLREIAHHLRRIGQKAHGWTFDGATQNQNAQRLASVTSTRHLEVDARRLFVKTWCGLLEAQSQHGERAYSEDELNDLLSGVHGDILNAQQQPGEDDLG
jgi:hypothetical protein